MSGFSVASIGIWQHLPLFAQQSDLSWIDGSLTSEHLTELIVFGFLTVVILVPSLAVVWYKARVKEWETSIKHVMLDRGMSAEEICSVLEAGSKGCHVVHRDAADQKLRSIS